MFFYAFIPGITAFVLISYKNGLVPKWSYHATLIMTCIVLLWAWGSFIWILKGKFEKLKTVEEKQKYALIGLSTLILVIVAVFVGRWFVHDYKGWGDMYSTFFDRIINP